MAVLGVVVMVVRRTLAKRLLGIHRTGQILSCGFCKLSRRLPRKGGAGHQPASIMQMRVCNWAGGVLRGSFRYCSNIGQSPGSSPLSGSQREYSQS